jgi:colanic acid/amylovoran biosynthesis glycosyltransferase
MRIAYLVSQYPAPTHTFIRREVHALRKRGVDVVTFGVRPPAQHERLSSVDQAEWERTFYLLPASLGALARAHLMLFTRPLRYFRTLKRAMDHRVPGAKAVLWAFFYFTEALILARELERRSIARLHNHFANAGAIVGYLATSFLGIPFSLTLHGMSEFEYPGGFLLRGKIEAADFVACVSHFGRAQAFKATRAKDWPKMHIVRCGVELSGLSPAPKLPDPKQPVRIVCVGRLSPEKGQIGLLEAFADALARGTRAELRLVGDGPERADVEARIRHLQLEAHCKLVGWKAEREVLEEIQKADILVMASFMEGLPVVLMEALGLAVPVIAPCVAGIPELVRDGETGLLFSPGHWLELTECLQMLCDDALLRERLGARGREVVAEEFDVDRAIEPLVQHFSGRAVDAPPIHRPRLFARRAPESSEPQH